MGIARRQRREFKKAYDKATKLNSIKPITTYSNPFEGLPVGEKFIEEYNKCLKQIAEDYEVNTSSN